MNKKQVGALLKFMPKDGTRPSIEQSKLILYDGRLTLAATNGYILAMVNVECDEEDGRELAGGHIARETLEKWHKLATGKSLLDKSELEQLVGESYSDYGYNKGDFPDVVKFIPDKPRKETEEDRKKCDREHGLNKIKFNANYAKTVQDLDGGGFLELDIVSKLSGLVMRSERGVYLIMPMK